MHFYKTNIIFKLNALGALDAFDAQMQIWSNGITWWSVLVLHHSFPLLSTWVSRLNLTVLLVEESWVELDLQKSHYVAFQSNANKYGPTALWCTDDLLVLALNILLWFNIPDPPLYTEWTAVPCIEKEKCIVLGSLCNNCPLQSEKSHDLYHQHSWYDRHCYHHCHHQFELLSLMPLISIDLMYITIIMNIITIVIIIIIIIMITIMLKDEY